MQVITTHLNADFDGLGAMIAARLFFPEALLVFPGSQDKHVRDFLTPELEKKYNIVRLKDLNIHEIKTLVVVDTRQKERLGPLASCLENPGVVVHIYDHHPATKDTLRGDSETIGETGSTCALFVRLFQEHSIPVTAEEATILLLGIYEDTGNFTFPTTTAADLNGAAWLLSMGADLQQSSRFSCPHLSARQIRLLSDLMRSKVVYRVNGVEVPVVKLSLREYEDEFALLIRRMADMENLDCLFGLIAMEGRIYLIARSRIPEVNAGSIAREFDGGGHASAASASIRDLTLVEVEERLLDALHTHVRPETLARDLMSGPPITVKPDVSIVEANRLLTQYNINVLPVVSDAMEIMGTISRMVVEKSIHHGMGGYPVSEFMTIDQKSLAVDAPLTRIMDLIIDRRQRFIPVVEGTTLKGVITRTDLLNLLVHDPATLPEHLLDRNNRPSTERNKNCNSIMVERLNRDTIFLLRTIGEIAEKNRFRAYIVGGFVRDLLLRAPNLDIDIVVEGDGIEFARTLARHLDCRITAHKKFNTAVVTCKDGTKIDIATARLEYYDYPAAMPTVEKSSIKRDLYRRDFTINALAIHLNPKKFGILVDYFNCQNDIKEQRIRILHNLSFVEDPTRVFRAIRLEQRMGFHIGRHTEKLMASAIRLNLMDRISGRRLFEELKLILSEENPLDALRRMDTFGLVAMIWPGRKLDEPFAALLTQVHRVVSWHRLLYLAAPCRAWLVYVMAGLAPAAAKEIHAFADRFALPPRTKKELIQQKFLADKTENILARSHTAKPSSLYQTLRDLSEEGLLYLMAITKKEQVRQAVSLFVTDLRKTTIALNGHDLKKMGYPEGPLFHKILQAVLDARLDGMVHNRSEETAFVEKKFAGLAKTARRTHSAL